MVRALAFLIVLIGALAGAEAQPINGQIAPLNGATVITTPQAGTFTIAGCTVTTSSAQCLAAGTATNHVTIQNAGALNNIACAWGAAAVLNGSASVQLTSGQSETWGPATSGVPGTALNCIAATSSTPLYLEYN